MQLSADNASGDTAALLQRLERLERQVAAGAVGASPEVKAPAPVDPATGRAALGGRARATPAAPAAVDDEPSPEVSEAIEAVAAVVEATAANISAEVWENTIRPALRGMARAVFAPAGFVRSTPSTLTLSVPNAVHRAKCEEQRQVVEAALADFVGSPVGVELLDGDGGPGDSAARTEPDSGGAVTPPTTPTPPDRSDADAGSERGEQSSSPRTRGLAAAAALGRSPEVSVDELATATAADELPDDDDVDLDDLVDAPPESVKSPIDRLAEAFPGSELIDEAG